MLCGPSGSCRVIGRMSNRDSRCTHMAHRQPFGWVASAAKGFEGHSLFIVNEIVGDADSNGGRQGVR